MMKAKHPQLVLSAILSFSLIGSAVQATDRDQLPNLGDISGNLMTPAQEFRLGQAFMRQVRASERLLDDPLLDEYLTRLGRRLVANSDAEGRNYSFFYVDDPVVNAFAGPAGHIGIHTGLFLTTETESELAAVLAHEIAHVTQQHLFRTWHAANQMSVPQAAVILAAIVLGAAVGGDAAQAAAMGGQASLIQKQIDFTRANEQEADRIGIALLANTGFEPRAMPAFFSRMERATRTYSSKLPEFLRTHPVTTNRIADSLGRADAYSYRQPTDEQDYLLARAILRARQYGSPDEAVLAFKHNLEDGRHRSKLAEQYGYAITLTASHDYKTAREVVDSLLAQQPDSPAFVIASANIYSKTRQTDKAINQITKLLELKPNHYPLNITLADMLLEAGRPEQAYQQLKKQLVQDDTRSKTYELLTRAAKETSRDMESHEYLAEYYYQKGATESAVLQLEIALRQKNLSFYDQSRLESRLNLMKEELEALKLQKKQKKI